VGALLLILKGVDRERISLVAVGVVVVVLQYYSFFAKKNLHRPEQAKRDDDGYG